MHLQTKRLLRTDVILVGHLSFTFAVAWRPKRSRPLFSLTFFRTFERESKKRCLIKTGREKVRLSLSLFIRPILVTNDLEPFQIIFPSLAPRERVRLESRRLVINLTVWPRACFRACVRARTWTGNGNGAYTASNDDDGKSTPRKCTQGLKSVRRIFKKTLGNEVHPFEK